MKKEQNKKQNQKKRKITKKQVRQAMCTIIVSFLAFLMILQLIII